MTPFARVLVSFVATSALSCAADSVAPPAWSKTVVSAQASVCSFGDLRECVEGCLAENPFSCDNLGAMYELGRGVDSDEETARSLYRSACGARADGACWNLARLARTEGAADAAEAICEGGDVSACAAQCLVGVGAGCEALASMYEAGHGVPRDARTAWRLYLFACDAGLASACVGALRNSEAAPEGARRLDVKDTARVASAPYPLEGIALEFDAYIYVAKGQAGT